MKKCGIVLCGLAVCLFGSPAQAAAPQSPEARLSRVGEIFGYTAALCDRPATEAHMAVVADWILANHPDQAEELYAEFRIPLFGVLERVDKAASDDAWVAETKKSCLRYIQEKRSVVRALYDEIPAYKRSASTDEVMAGL